VIELRKVHSQPADSGIPTVGTLTASGNETRMNCPKRFASYSMRVGKKRFRDLAAMITVLFGRIRLAETKRREWRV